MAINKQRQRRHRRVRAKVIGSPIRPRLNVFRSLNHIYAQVIDDKSGKTLAAASTKELKTKANKSAMSEEVGRLLGKKAKAAGITQVIFDRGGYSYHGRIKRLADGAREAGLEF